MISKLAVRSRIQRGLLFAICSWLLVALFGSVPCCAQSAPAPDSVYLNGMIATMDAQHPSAQAFAVRGDRIVAVGSNADVMALADVRTRRIDLRGHFVTPGFNDAHTHMAQAGGNKLQLDLTGAGSLDEFQRKVREYAATLPNGAWILGGQWDQTLWPGQRFPTRLDLDAVTGDHPAYLERMDGHGAVANTKALQIAGVNRSTTIPAGGRIGRDDNGTPNGLFFEGAKALITSHIPAPSPDYRRRALSLAILDAISHGVTSVQDYSTWDDFIVMEQMEQDGDLHVRISEWLPFTNSLETLKSQRAHHNPNDPLLHTGMLKGFMDGSLGSRTAALLAPYTDDPANSGLPQYSQEQLNAMAVERAAAGFQLGFHAIGDRAVQMALNAFAAAQAAAPRGGGARNRIEHLQVVAPADIPRLKELGVVASVQPSHLLDDGRWAEARLGPIRAKTSYLWKTPVNLGVVVAFGTDYPVEGISPFPGLYSAVTRSALDGSWTYQAQERLTIDQALHAYTTGSAYAQFAENEKGTIAPGRLADFVVLSEDLLTAPPKSLLDTKVYQTYVGGREVFHAQGY